MSRDERRSGEDEAEDRPGGRLHPAERAADPGPAGERVVLLEAGVVGQGHGLRRQEEVDGFPEIVPLGRNGETRSRPARHSPWSRYREPIPTEPSGFWSPRKQARTGLQALFPMRPRRGGRARRGRPARPRIRRRGGVGKPPSGRTRDRSFSAKSPIPPVPRPGGLEFEREVVNAGNIIIHRSVRRTKGILREVLSDGRPDRFGLLKAAV